MNTKTLRFAIVVLLAGALLLSGCDMLPIGTPKPTTPTPGTPPAVAMLPELPNYTTVEGRLLTDYISSLSEGAALLAGYPELAATAAVIDQIITCYQDIGAVQARVHSKQDSPLSAGAVAIADRNALLNPINIFKCVQPSAFQLQGEDSPPPLAIQPCSGTYTLSRDGNDFYIIYAGTTMEVCDTLCAGLEGCDNPHQRSKGD